MLGATAKSESSDKFTPLGWIAVSTWVSGLIFVFVTKNMKLWAYFNISAGSLGVVDYFVQRQTSPQLAASILRDATTPKAKVKFGALSWVGFALLLISSGFISHVRIFASLMMAAACLLIFDRYKRARS
ncbi:MAG: hypothetical protein WCA15_17705 [Candidatus Acidiferrales bacterium]